MQCTNGSQPRAAAPTYFWFTWSAFIAWLALRFARFGTIVWAFFGDQTRTVAEFCATEPVIPTAPTTAQWLGFFTLDFASRVYVENYLLACFAAYLWPTYCECLPSSGTGSTCYFGYASYPHGWANSSTLGACRWYTQEFSVTGSTTVYGARAQLDTAGQTTHVYLWNRTLGGVVVLTGDVFTSVVGDHFYYFTTPYNLVAGNLYSIGIQFNGLVHFDSTLTRTNNSEITYGDQCVSTDCGQTVVPTAYEGRSWPVEPIVCNGGPPSGYPDIYTPPLPTDPVAIPDHPEVTCSTTADLCARVNALQSALLVTQQNINWLQSSVAPTCWVPGTPLTSLTGAGTFVAADVVGLYVQLTIPPAWGKTAEVPARYIPKLGELHPTVDAVQVDEFQMHYATEQFLKVPIATNGFAYSLKPGVTATMTPLHRCK